MRGRKGENMNRFYSTRGLQRFLPGLVVLFALLTLMYSCMPSRLKKLKLWHQNGEYEQVVQSPIDCIDQSPECFEIKLIRADSYYRLGKFGEAYVYIKDALHRVSPKISRTDLITAYTLYSEVLFEKAKQTDEFLPKRNFVNQLLRNVEIALKENASLKAGEQAKKNQELLTRLQAEALLMKMDLVEPDSLIEMYQKLQTVADKLEELFPGEGYREYYRLRGEFKWLLPELKQAILKHKPLEEATRTRFLQLAEAAQFLRQKPIYRQGYAGAIDLFLDNVERFRKQIQ